jgi:hypothetical protein
MKLQTKLSSALVVLLAIGLGYGWRRFHQPGRVKDGWAFIGKNSGCVFVSEERNKITWEEADQVLGWTGRLRSEAETVYFDGHRVYPFSWSRVFPPKGFIIRFLPQRIEVFDLGHLNGKGYSPRELPS